MRSISNDYVKVWVRSQINYISPGSTDFQNKLHIYSLFFYILNELNDKKLLSAIFLNDRI